MADADIGVKIAIEGEAEFKKALKDITSATKALQAEMKLTSNVYADNASGVQALTSKGEVLQKQIDAQREKVDVLNKALENAEKNFAGNTEKINDYAKKLNYAKSDLIDLERAQRENNEALESAAKGTEDLGNKQEETGAKTSKFGGVLQKIGDLFGIKLPDGISKGIDSLGVFDSKMSGTEESATGGFDNIVGSIGGIDPAAAAAVMAIGGIGIAAAKMTADTILEIDRLSAHMKVALGLTDEEAREAGQVIEALYLSPIIENRDEAEQALTAVMQLMGASGEQAASYAEKVAFINQTWGEDFTDTAQTASTLMQNFGITGDEALNLIIAGMQTSANKNRDLLDTFNEYSFIFKTVGNDADMMLSRIIAGTDAGAYSADKAADAFKIFFEGALEQNGNFKEGIDALGLSSKQIANDIASGGDRASQAVEIVAQRLSGVRNEADRTKIASQLFGEAYKQLGIDSILAMASVEDSTINSTSRATKAMTDMIDTVSSKWDAFWKIAGNAVVQQGKGTIWNAIDTINAYGNIPHNASGTSFFPGGLSWVGEKGPELVSLPRGSSIFSNEQSGRMGRETFVHKGDINITIDAKNVKDFNSVVDKAVKERLHIRQGYRPL